MSTRPENERLARIETLLETHVQQSRESRAESHTFEAWVRSELKSMNDKIDANHRQFEAVKNKGAGMLLGVAAAGGAAGAGVLKIVQSLFSGG